MCICKERQDARNKLYEQPSWIIRRQLFCKHPIQYRDKTHSFKLKYDDCDIPYIPGIKPVCRKCGKIFE